MAYAPWNQPPPLEELPIDDFGGEETLAQATRQVSGATCETMSAIVWAVRTYWGEYGYSIRHTSGGVFQVSHSDGSRLYLKADRYGNVAQLT